MQTNEIRKRKLFKFDKKMRKDLSIFHDGYNDIEFYNMKQKSKYSAD